MDDLVAELGMSKKTLYACFAKTALVETVLKDKVGEIEADLKQLAEKQAPDAEAAFTSSSAAQRHTAEVQPVFIRGHWA